jgi:hypothetical protein
MSDDFSDPANWHPIEEHPYLNDPPKVTYPPTPGGAREAVARALHAQLHGDGDWDSLHGRLKMVYLEDACDALNAITAAGFVVTTPTAIAAEIRAWANGEFEEYDRADMDRFDAIASRICGEGKS